MKNTTKSFEAMRGIAIIVQAAAFMFTVAACENNGGNGGGANILDTMANPISLTENTWADGSITSTASGSDVWYSLDAASETAYYVWWNDSGQGNSTKTLDISVSAVYSNGTSVFTDRASGWASPQQFTARTNDTVYIKVYPSSRGSIGTFAIAYSISDTRPASYAVTFSANGGSGTVPSITVTPGSSITLPGGSGLSRSGYIFGGWCTSDDGTGDNYSDGESFTPNADTTLYAVWNSTITFDRNGGTGSTPGPQTVRAGTSIMLPDDSGFSRTGYTFDGWDTNSSGTGTKRNAGSSYTPAGNITLYARWICTVTFNINGGIGTAPASRTASAGSSITLPGDSGFSKSGYIFFGWNTSADGTGTSRDAGSSYTPIGDVTLYAKWAAGTEADPIPLTGKIWTDGNIATSNGEVWYSFYASSNTTYRVWWNDSYNGNGTKTGDVYVTAYGSNGAVLFNNVDSGWGSPQTITLISGATINLKVTSSGIGTFAIGYSTGSIRSELRIRPPASHTALTAGSWTNGNITTSAREAWYSFTAAANTTYGVWWNDSSAGDGSKTLDVQVRAYDSNGIELFSENASWTFNLASTVKVASGGTVYLRVLPMSGVAGNSTGSFGIIYGTGFVRPDISHTTLTANQWKDGTIGIWGETWYSFTAAANTTYRVWWNDNWYGDGTKTARVQVTAYDNNGTELFSSSWGGWSSPQTITLLSGSTIYLRVTSYFSNNTGTFAIAYNTGSTRP